MYITFTHDSFSRFTLMYDEAVKSGAKSFLFEGNEFLCEYAKYLIEYYRQRQQNRAVVV